MVFGNDTIDFNSLGIASPLNKVFHATLVNRDWDTGAILDDDNVRFTMGDEGEQHIPEGASLIQEQEMVDWSQIRMEDATQEQIATGQLHWERDVNTQAHQDLFDGMGNFVGSGELPDRFGEGIGGSGTQTYVTVERSFLQRAWCLIGNCDEVNTQTQQELEWMENYDNGEIEEGYEEGDDSQTQGSLSGWGINRMTQSDEEALQRKEDETHIKGGSTETSQDLQTSGTMKQVVWALVTIGVCIGLYQNEKSNSTVMNAYKKIKQKLKTTTKKISR